MTNSTKPINVTRREIAEAFARGAKQFVAMQMLVANILAQREGNTDEKHVAQAERLATKALLPDRPNSWQALFVHTFFLPKATRTYVRKRIRAMEMRLFQAQYSSSQNGSKRSRE